MGIVLNFTVLISILKSVAFTKGGAPAMNGMQVIGCFAAIRGIVLLVSGVPYLLMLEKLGKTLKAQSALTRQTWAAQPV